jgi:hypothetical protein
MTPNQAPIGAATAAVEAARRQPEHSTPVRGDAP